MMPKRAAVLTTLAIAAALLVLAPSASAGVVENIRLSCAEQWPGDYRMQEYCIKKQTESAGRYATLLQMHPAGTEERNILGRCLGEWLDDRDRVDYRMAVYCSEKQLEAYRRLQP